MQRTLDHFQAALVEEQGLEDGAAEEGEQPQLEGREAQSQLWWVMLLYCIRWLVGQQLDDIV